MRNRNRSYFNRRTEKNINVDQSKEIVLFVESLNGRLECFKQYSIFRSLQIYRSRYAQFYDSSEGPLFPSYPKKKKTINLRSTHIR